MGNQVGECKIFPCALRSRHHKRPFAFPAVCDSIFKFMDLEGFGIWSTLQFALFRRSILKATRSKRMLRAACATVDTRSLVDTSSLGTDRVTAESNFAVQSDRARYMVLPITSQHRGHC